MIINALRKKYEYEIASAKANIAAYQKNPTGIGEHPDLVSEIDKFIEKFADAQGKLDSLKMMLAHTADSKNLKTKTVIKG